MKRVLTGLGVTALLGVFLAYGAYAGLLYTVQDQILFPVPSMTRDQLDAQAKQAGVEPFEVVASDGVRLYGWHRRGVGKRGVLVFHGNGGGLGIVAWVAEQVPGDVDVLGVHYRGYPGSEGHPHEAGLRLDAEALYEKATVELGIPADQLVFHGQSMGGGVAVMLAEAHPPKALSLDSTFLSIERLAGEKLWFAPTFLLHSPFRSEERAPGVDVPTLVIHGDRDHLIPVHHGRALAKLLPNATYIEVPGGGHDRFLPAEPGVFEQWQRFMVDQLER